MAGMEEKRVNIALLSPDIYADPSLSLFVLNSETILENAVFNLGFLVCK